jgi:putative endonuclease
MRPVDSADGRPAIGRIGEDAALARYTAAGYRLIARNWRCRLGELDLVVARGAVVVVCEVKTRRGSLLGGPYESVTLRKQQKLRRLAQVFLSSELRALAGAADPDVRFDVASVTVGPAGVEVHVFEDAF